MADRTFQDYRFFLKDSIRKFVDFSTTAQNRGVPPPPIEKPYAADREKIALPDFSEMNKQWSIPLVDAIANRKSMRGFSDVSLSLEELSFLLWSTQGLRKNVNAVASFRTVPSAGARHSVETYLFVRSVEGLEEGLYRYLPVEHQLLVEFREENLNEKLAEAALGQQFVSTAALSFVWTTIPYRMEWRYAQASYKVIALDAGHICQNLYLACEAIGAGTCAIAAYDQSAMDALLRVDGEEEFTLYMAPVGKRVGSG